MTDNKKATFRPLYRKDGTSEFVEFYKQLPEKDQDKLLILIKNTEEKGIRTAIQQSWVKKLDKNLYELRSKVGTNIQRAFYFKKSGSEYLITHGFTKQTQKTPKREIEHAKQLRQKYQNGELL